MAASKMRFSPSSPPGTRRRCPAHAGEPPKHARGPRHSQHRVDLSCPLDTTPQAPTGCPSTPTTRAPGVRGVTGRVSAPRRAPPRAPVRTCSACAGVAPHRGGPCGAPRAPRGAAEPGHAPDVHAARGREEHEGRGSRLPAPREPAPGTQRAYSPVMADFPPPLPNLRHLRPLAAKVERGAAGRAGPRAARRPSPSAPSARTWSPWVLAEGHRACGRVPYHVAHIPAHPAPVRPWPARAPRRASARGKRRALLGP